MIAPHILIVGAGIGGLTAAIALARKGFLITLAEASTGFAEIGAGIQLSPNATHVLDGLGLSASLARHVVQPEQLDIRNWGKPRSFASMPMNRPGSGEAPFWLCRRAHLQTVLLDAVRTMPNIRLLLGRRLTALEQDEAGITATLLQSQGQSTTLQANALVGADGIWSQTRALCGDAAPPVFTGHEAWRALVPVAAVPAFMRKAAVGVWLGPKAHLVHYPVAAGQMLNVVLVREAAAARDGWGSYGDRAELAGLTAKAAPPLRELLNVVPDWQVWSLFDRQPTAMAKGRVGLLGDAAHPVLPFLAQGAALAIEDAGVLAQQLSLAAASGSARAIPDALKTYASLRASRVLRVQQAARANGRSFHFQGPLAFVRDLMIRRLDGEAMRRRYNWLYDWRLSNQL